MNKSEREPPKVLTYQIWKYSDYGFEEEVENINFDQKWQKYSPKIVILRFGHETYKYERDPPKVLDIKFGCILTWVFSICWTKSNQGSQLEPLL